MGDVSRVTLWDYRVSQGVLSRRIIHSVSRQETPASCYDKRRSGLTSAQQAVGSIRQEQMFLVQESSLEAIAQ